MTSIPADPSITLGNIIDIKKIEQLLEIAQLQKPVDLANDRLNSLILSTYKLKMIFNQMVNLQVPSQTLEKLTKEIKDIKSDTSLAAVDLAEVLIQSESDIRDAKMTMAQTKISMSIESPIDWGVSKLVPQPISYDSLVFDVQYFSSLSSQDQSSATSSSKSKTSTKREQSVSKRANRWLSFSLSTSSDVSNSHTDNMHKTSNEQIQESSLHGIIVITAKCTHKNADIFDPCVLDAKKSVAAWNYTYPDDRLGTDPTSIMEAALSENEEGEKNKKKTLRLVSGASRSSSFVGFCNILKTDESKTSSESESAASAVTQQIKEYNFLSSLTGQSSTSNSNSSTVANAFATSTLETSCSLSVIGCIPSIVANDHIQIVKGLDPDPSKIMNQLSAINEAASGSTQEASNFNAGAGDAANGAKFMELSSEHLKNSASTLADKAEQKNKVVDLVTMMTAFEDYVEQAKAGECGVPTSYFIKELDKHEIAKVYVREFYPNGATTGKDAMAGQIGNAVEGGKKTET